MSEIRHNIVTMLAFLSHYHESADSQNVGHIFASLANVCYISGKLKNASYHTHTQLHGVRVL
jgi:hypothetical protein